MVSSFSTISSTGVYSAGPFTEISEVGVYSISVTAVTLNSVVVTTMIGTSSFTLSVTANPCNNAVVIAPTPSSISLVVYTAMSAYGLYSSFTYTSTVGSTACGPFTYTASITPIASISPTTFSIDTVNMNF
jgi:hypothetical protein